MAACLDGEQGGWPGRLSDGPAQGMTTYVAAQRELSFRYDLRLGSCHERQQRLTLAIQAQVSDRFPRRGKIRATRSSGFVDIESIFDGSTFHVPCKDQNVYMQIPIARFNWRWLVMSLKDNTKGHCRLPTAAAEGLCRLTTND